MDVNSYLCLARALHPVLCAMQLSNLSSEELYELCYTAIFWCIYSLSVSKLHK